MGTGEFNVGGNPTFYAIHGGVEILLVASCHKNRDKPRPDGPLGSYVDFLSFGQNRYRLSCQLLVCLSLQI